MDKKLLTARSTLSKMQREVYDTIIFGKPINSTTLVQGPGGTGKTHVLLASLVDLLAMGFKALLVCKEENTADCLASRALKEVSHDQICRFYPQGMVNAYKNRASVLGYEEDKSDFQGEKISAWSLRQRSTHEIKKAKVVVASVNGCEAVVDAGFNPDIDEASLIKLSPMRSCSVLAVVIAGDPNQCRPHFISEAVNTHFPALSFCPLERLNTDNAERSMFSLKENFRQVPELGELYSKLAHAKDRMVFVPRPSPVLINNVNQAILQRALPFDSNYDGQGEFFLDVACISHRQDNTHSISNTGGVDAIAEVIKYLVERDGVARDQISAIKLLLIYQSIFISKYFPEL
ncbi:helicase [Neofusicoccum ribis]|uniref:Helicase n=1 Tax=Neofusicoccum ribis TaxID=45134 RepID=A0ABR3TDD2_9PEZI